MLLRSTALFKYLDYPGIKYRLFGPKKISSFKEVPIYDYDQCGTSLKRRYLYIVLEVHSSV